MNHRTVESRIQHTHHQPGTARHSHSQQPAQSKLNQGHHGQPAMASAAEKTERLLATVLVFYRDAMINPLSDSIPPPFYQELQAHVQSHSPLACQFISKGDSTQERRSADIALALGSAASLSGWTLVEYLFYTIVNLQRPQLSPKSAIEKNAKAVFNVMVASIVEGAPAQDCERLLLLCIHLKDTENCYPLRGLAGDICLDMARESSLPYFARTSILRLILGPADFIMHHLETRIRLTDNMTGLLREDSCEDLEFWTLVQRIAKKIGLRRPTSALERLKCRLYHYLDLVVADPRVYCTQEKLIAYMPLPQWKSAMSQDLVLYFYLRDHKHQMLLFLETVRVLGLKISLFEPGETQRTILETLELENEAIIQLALVHRQISAYTNDSLIHANEDPIQAQHSAQGQVERTLEVILEALEPTSKIQETLCHANSQTVKTITSTGVESREAVEQLQDLAERLLSISAVVPVQLLPTVMWSTVLIQRVCKELETIRSKTHSPGPPDDYVQIQRMTALCLDIFQTCVVHRNEPRFCIQPSFHALSTDLGGSIDPKDQLRPDLDLSLTTFAILFPAHELSTWACPSSKAGASLSQGQNMRSQERLPVCSHFLVRLFEHLVPLLERVTQKDDDDSSGTLVLAGSVLQLLSLQLPSEVLLLEVTELANTLLVCADLQRDSSLSRSARWLAMFDPAACPHPFPLLQSRLHNAAEPVLLGRITEKGRYSINT